MKLISATITARLPARQAVRPPIVSSARAGPYSTVNVVFPSIVAANFSRSWSVGYRPWKLDGGDDREAGEDRDPHGEQDPVPPQHEPREGQRSGHPVPS